MLSLGGLRDLVIPFSFGRNFGSIWKSIQDRTRWERKTDIPGERSSEHSRREVHLHGNGWATICNGTARQTKPSQIKHPEKNKRNFKIRINKGLRYSLLVTCALE